MTIYQSGARLIWALSGSGQSTTISGAGNSGAWTTGPNVTRPSAVDLGIAADVWLSVSVAAITSSPSLTVSLGGFDLDGNLFGPLLSTAAITAAGQAAPVFAGQHGGSTSYVVFPQWGQAAWTCTGGSCTGVEIALYGRG